ncbi:MAG: DUF4430 domain-containing protein [Oscillospiraceae bacterium]|nr:DUF4430 domain-containing protein [Oscillospiraceae bacterium]
MHKQFCQLAAGFAALGMFLCGIRLLLPFTVSAEADPDAAAAEILADLSGGDAERWIAEMTAAPAKGANDWYMLALANLGGYALDGYAEALAAEIKAHSHSSATSRERSALTVIACGDGVPDICAEILQGSIGKQGIMSWVFGLHLLNNGVTCDVSAYEAVSALLEQQLPDGGWAVTGQYGDPDVTAMVLQAIAPYRNEKTVAAKAENAVQFLSKKQLDTGAFSSYGAENPESTAQVILALNSLGISPLSDPRFIKSGTLLDGIMQFSLGNGHFSHTLGGEANDTAAVQVFLALTALRCGRPCYLYRGNPPALEIPAVTSETTTSAATTSTEQNTVTAAATSAAQTVLTSGTQTDAQTASLQTAAISVKETGSTAETAVSSEILTDAKPPETAAETAGISDITTAFSAAAQTSSAAVQTAETQITPQNGEKYPYRIPVTVGAGAVFVCISAVCLIRGKRSPKTYLTLLCFCGGAAALAWIIKIESPEQYYQAPEKAGSAGAVSMAIRCDVILGMDGAEKYPADGIILPETEFVLDEGDTALDVLYDAVKTYGLQIEVDGVSGDVIDNAYVRGIASLYEFDFGDLSGWTYTVNGERPSVGAGAFSLHDGDVIVWAYTVTL